MRSLNAVGNHHDLLMANVFAQTEALAFGKTAEQSMTALARLREFEMFGLPILVGASRKRFIASVSPSEPKDRLAGSIAAHLIAAQRGAKIIRTHDVAETLQALRVAHAIEGKQ